jgi:hypothetical protein
LPSTFTLILDQQCQKYQIVQNVCFLNVAFFNVYLNYVKIKKSPLCKPN